MDPKQKEAEVGLSGALRAGAIVSVVAVALMRAALGVALALYGAVAFAQKWVDEKGKVYYGEPPPGVSVKRAPMTKGATSSVGSQGGSSRGSVSDQERAFQERARDRAIIDNNDRVMRDNAANRDTTNRILKDRAEQRRQGYR